MDIKDAKNKKSFYQVYKNNMKQKSEPVIEDYDGTEGSVKITYIPDIKYFNLK